MGHRNVGLFKWYLQFSSEFQIYVIGHVPFSWHAKYPNTAISRLSISCLSYPFCFWSEVICVWSGSVIGYILVKALDSWCYALVIKIREHQFVWHMARVGWGGLIKRRKHQVREMLMNLRGKWNRSLSYLVVVKLITLAYVNMINVGSGLSLDFLGKSYALVNGSESGKQNSERFVWISGHIQIQTYIQSELFFHSYTVINTHVRLLCLRSMSTGRLVKHSYMLKCKHTKYIHFIT